jgi:iron(III) transport system ATP-binding protein
MTTLSISNLSIAYGKDVVIADLSLRIDDGSLFTLLGPSGCGKTTLLRTLAGFIPVRSGQIHFGDRDVTHVPAHLRDVGMVFQDYALFPDKTVFDNVAYGLRARAQSSAVITRTVGEYLERVGLGHLAERLPAQLSGGQRQRVALARALAIKPTVLLMDEPLSNLDAKLRVQVRETIADLQKEVGITTVLVTHDQEEALALSDRIGLMRAGSIEQAGTPEQLYAQPTSSYVAQFIGAANTVPITIASAVEAQASVPVQWSASQMTHTINAIAPQALDAGKVMLIARPETLQLVPADNQGSNQLPCTVRRRQYLGARTVYTIEVTSPDSNDPTTLHVECKESLVQWQAGQTARVQFDAANTWVVRS